MEVLDSKCPGCGAKLKFNPVNQLWNCEYCGNKYTLEQLEKHEKSSSKTNNKKNLKEEKLDGIISYNCKNCGAQIMADEQTVATTCVYCGSTAILKEKIEKGIMPSMIIPFKNTKKDAALAFSKLTKNKPLMPKMFKQVSNIDNISGVYIPFWAYDMTCDGDVSYNCTDISTWTDMTYQYTKTTRYLTKVNAHLDYEKVLADASSRFKDELMDSIEPFNFSQLVKYDHAYLSGFLAEKYDVSENEAFPRAKERTMNTCLDLTRTKVFHQTNIVTENNLKLEKTKTDYIMLPVWMVNIKYKDKIYTFAMNGQTGKMVGDIPIGIKETIIWILVIFITTLLIGLIIARLSI